MRIGLSETVRDSWMRLKIRKLLHDLKLVRSLDLEGAPLAEFPKEIVELTLLRYLSLRGTQVATVPKSIKKLAYLETLDLKQTFVTKLPFEIYALKSLRHLLVYRNNFKNYVAFDSVQGVEVPAGVKGLSAIQKLSLINATKHKKIIAELKALVQLRKLGLIGLKREDGRAFCASIKEMRKLLTLDVSSSHKEEYIELDDMDDKPPSILQRLYLEGRLHKIPGWISSLHSLVRIGLRWSRLETSPLEALQVLPNLMELEMVDAYTGDTLEFKAETFKELKFLHLEQIDSLNTVIVEEKAMPKLEKLTICKCEKMELLPLHINKLTKLQELLVYDMHNNFINRLQKNSDFRYMIEHIPVVHSFTLDSNQDCFRAATDTATPTHRHFTPAVDLSAACPSLSICHLPPIIVNQSSSVGRRLSVITRSSSSRRVAARRLQLVQLFIDQQVSILEFSTSSSSLSQTAQESPIQPWIVSILEFSTSSSSSLSQRESQAAKMAESAVSAALILVEEVLSFLEREANLQKDVRGDVQRIKSWLSAIQASLKHMDGKEGDDILKDRVSQVRDLAYDIEDVLDEFRVHVPTKFHRHRISKYVERAFHHVKHRNALREMSSEVQRIKRMMDDIIALDLLRSNSLEEGPTSGARVELCHVTPKEDDMVGFEGHKESLINYLVGDSMSGLKHIWVVGIGGSGKTILVKNVYESKKVLKEYDCHAWIHVSRSCKIDEVLRSMLKQLCKVRKQSNLLDEGEVRDKLKSDLQRRRYLLVLDDVWGEDDWKSIVHALPQGSGGSKIIVTSPKHNLAKSCVGSSDYILEIKGLEWKEAWDLFCKKAFPSEKCCPRKELVEWSQKIVKKCEGLPLAIAAVGSLLSKKRQIPIEWKKLHDSLGSEIDSDYSLAIISRILLPSYKDLSNNLKNCFLYFSIFPEDYSIARERLIRLWIAEGFIKERGGKTLEDVAEDYLNELIGRNLVDVSKWDFDGRVKFCRVQNLIQEFIILKSKEENFVKLLAESDSSSSTDYKIRRLSIHHSKTRWSDRSGLRCVRSLFIFEWDASLHSRIRKLLQHLKLVRSLDLEGAPLTEFPEEIVELTLLKYLSLRGTQVATVPKSIKKLAYLETLDLKHTCVTKLPFEIYALKFLRHLLVYRYNFNNYVAFDSVQGVEVPAGVEGLSAIQKLLLINATKHKKIIAELKALVQLRKLGLIGLKREDGRALCASIKEMEKLLTLDLRSSRKEEYIELDDMDDKPPTILQRLYLKGRLHKIPGWISSLHSLVRIGLRWSKLETSPLEALQVLPNLMELEMVDAYTGNTLEFKTETFKELKFLHLEQIDRLSTVIVEAKAMPKLEKLTICKCEKMEMLPLYINNLTKLQELLVYDMHNNFIKRLQKNSEFRDMIEHIPVIHSFTLESNQDWSLQNFS
ncbi:hypothetical protein LWI29_013471 [Acer saccharum]|uniref:Uncharacterized protein n=1 Tax=Acer saccharum TaxID=4024 RepID=A0AA39SZG8_ACESA|nr:hypothetical protein LWI29_013471 [Acer saccharum]